MKLQLTRLQYGTVKVALARMDDDEANTQGEYARNAAGWGTSTNDPNACKFCFMGHFLALRNGALTMESIEEIFTVVGMLLAESIGSSKVGYANDIYGTAFVRDLVRSKLPEIEVVR